MKKTTMKQLVLTMCGIVVIYAVFFWIVRDPGGRLMGLISGGIGALSAIWFTTRNKERIEAERKMKEHQNVESER